jgi:hypothetical protein
MEIGDAMGPPLVFEWMTWKPPSMPGLKDFLISTGCPQKGHTGYTDQCGENHRRANTMKRDKGRV